MYCICCLGGSYGIPYDYELKNVLPQIMEIEIIDEMTWYLINFTTVDGTSLTDFMIREEFIGMYDLIAPLGPQQVEAFMASDMNTRTLRDLLPQKKCTKLYCICCLHHSTDKHGIPWKGGDPFEYNIKNIHALLCQKEVIDGLTWHLVEFSTVDGKHLHFLDIFDNFECMYDGIARVSTRKAEKFKNPDTKSRTLSVFLLPKWWILPPKRWMHPEIWMHKSKCISS